MAKTLTQAECFATCSTALGAANKYIEELELGITKRENLITEVINQNKELERQLKKSVLFPSKKAWYQRAEYAALLGIVAGLYLGVQVAK